MSTKIIILAFIFLLWYNDYTCNEGKFKMALGFRKSLFGFNQTDVVEYIERTHKKFKIKADELNGKLDRAKKDYECILAEKNEISEKLAEFTKKADEIELLSEKIGKLYLVSQTNAQVIMTNAEESSNISKNEVEKNLSAIDEAHISLNELRENIMKTSDNFIKEVDALLSSLSSTKEQITENLKEAEQASQNFTEVYENIVNK